MDFPSSLRDKLTERLREARVKYPAALSADGRAFLVDGGLGYGAYVSPEGDVFMETYDLATDSEAKCDRSERAQAMVLVLGSRRMPELGALIPARPTEAVDCAECVGEGWRRFGPEMRFICQACGGLGWCRATS